MGRTFDPSRPDFAPYGFYCERWAPKPMPRSNRHNEIELNLLVSGSITYLLGGRFVTVRAGRLVAFWAATPHQVVGVEGSEDYFAVALPLAWFLQWDMPAPFVARLLQGEVIAEQDASRARRDIAVFAGWVEDLEVSHADRRRAVLLEMEARLLRLAETGGRPGGRAKGAGLASPILGKVESMAMFIMQNYTERISAADIAQVAKLAPTYAMAVFRKAFGLTLIEYLTQQRLVHAQRLLITSDAKVLDVALSSGFNSISRFNEAFGRAFGCSPSQFRMQHHRPRDRSP